MDFGLTAKSRGSGDCHDLMKAVFKIKGTGSSISGRSEKALGLVGKENPEKRSRGKDFGSFNPLEKYQSNWIISPNRGENEKYLKPPPRLLQQKSLKGSLPKRKVVFQPSIVHFLEGLLGGSP